MKRPATNATEYPDPTESSIECDSKNEPDDKECKQEQDPDIADVKKWTQTAK